MSCVFGSWMSQITSRTLRMRCLPSWAGPLNTRYCSTPASQRCFAVYGLTTTALGRRALRYPPPALRPRRTGPPTSRILQNKLVHRHTRVPPPRAARTLLHHCPPCHCSRSLLRIRVLPRSRDLACLSLQRRPLDRPCRFLRFRSHENGGVCRGLHRTV